MIHVMETDPHIAITMGIAYAPPDIQRQVSEIFDTQELVGEFDVIKPHDHCTWYKGCYMGFGLLDDKIKLSYPESFKIEKYFTNSCTIYRIFDSEADYVWHKLKYE